MLWRWQLCWLWLCIRTRDWSLKSNSADRNFSKKNYLSIKQNYTRFHIPQSQALKRDVTFCILDGWIICQLLFVSFETVCLDLACWSKQIETLSLLSIYFLQFAVSIVLWAQSGKTVSNWMGGGWHITNYQGCKM